MDEITAEKAVIKSESHCQAVTLLVHDVTFDRVMTGSLSHSRSVFLLLWLWLQLKHCSSLKMNGSTVAIDPNSYTI